MTLQRHRPRALWRGLVAAGVIAASLMLTTTAASASCVPPVEVPEAVAQADLVVVGTVTATRSHDRIASVRVEELWRGNADASVEIFGGPEEGVGATSVDRTYQAGTRYLIFAQEPEAHGFTPTFGGRYEDNNCSTTQPWSDELAQFRPAGARRAPSDSTVDDGAATSAWIVALPAVAGAAVVGGLVVWLRRRRHLITSSV